jgi:preprotein translocase subunit YajC
MITAIVLAETGAQSAANPIVQLVPFLLIGVVFYFLIIRPQRRRQQEQQKLLKQLSPGDEVVTIGGFYGEIVSIDEDTLRLEIDDDVIVTLARNAVSRTVSQAAPAAAVAEDDDVDDFGDDDADADR